MLKYFLLLLPFIANAYEPIDCGQDLPWTLSLSGHYRGHEVPENLLLNFDNKSFYRVIRPNFQNNLQLEFCLIEEKPKLHRVIRFSPQIKLYTEDNSDFHYTGFEKLYTKAPLQSFQLTITPHDEDKRVLRVHSFQQQGILYTLVYQALFIDGQFRPTDLGILSGFLLDNDF